MAVSVRPAGGRLLLGVRVSPAARSTTLRGVYGDRIKVSVSAPPEDNRANQELTRALAKWLGLRPEQVRVEAGHASRDKVVALAGLEERELRARLADLFVSEGLREGRAR